MKTARSILYFLIFILAIILATTIYQQENQKIKHKEALIELSKIKYGLFNVDEWKSILAEIISLKIEEFNLEGDNKEKMRKKIIEFLSVEIDKFERRYYQEKTQTFIGTIKASIAYTTGAFRKLKLDIPEFADAILNFLDEEENRTAIKRYIGDKINAYADSTFSKTDYTTIGYILNEYEQSDIHSAQVYLRAQIQDRETRSETYKILLILLAVISFLLLFLLKETRIQEFIWFLSISLIFLILGVLLPMIEIDARIDQMSFKLLGQDVNFYDQVLYYKSKSILEVVHLMLMQYRVDLMAVGILVFTFSVMFPVTKLICSAIFLLNKKARNMRFVKFMVFKSGKWSMADVMVIAIFMAYIGFDGIISEQLRQLEKITQNIDLLTTNKSNLLYGFYAFTTFVLLSLGASYKIQRKFVAETPSR